MMFPAFLKLRKIDPQRERSFKVPGGKGLLWCMTWIPEFLLLLTVIFTAVPLSTTAAELSAKVPILIGVIVTLVVGELVVRIAERREVNQRLKIKETQK